MKRCVRLLRAIWSRALAGEEFAAIDEFDVVTLGARRELRQQLLIVRVVGLHDLAHAELLEALDRLRREVAVPVVEVELVPGGERRERLQQ